MLSEIEKSWLQIFRSKNVGPISFKNLFSRYSPEQAIKILKSKQISVISRESIEAEIKKTEEIGARIIFFKHPEYPKILLNYRDLPPFLIVKGRIELLNKRCVSIIGSRNSSIHGNKIAKNLAAFLSERDYTIVSGMARGIDTSAHVGAMRAQEQRQKVKGSTIAFLAGGIDNIYPPENSLLYQEIASKGLLVSENPVGTVPAAMYFHSRNRIVAAISEAVVVVEATKNSGSLITAQYGLDYSKEICCIPGCPLDPRSYGPNRLIKNGANLIQIPEDLLEVLKQKKPSYTLEAEEPIELGTTEDVKKKLVSILSLLPINIEQLSAELDCPIQIIRQKLVELELEGMVKHLPGDLICLSS